MSNFFDLLETADSKSAHQAEFGHWAVEGYKPPEEELYEFELARLGARQASKFLQTVYSNECGRFPYSNAELNRRGLKLAQELDTSIGRYQGLSVPMSVEPEHHCVTIRPKVRLSYLT